MPEVLDWQRGDPRLVLQRAVKELTAGRLVVFPTETGYHLAASPLCPQALSTLGRLCPTDQAALAVRDLSEALHWAPWMSSTARRLARRVWPGPVVLFLDSQGEGANPSPFSTGQSAIRLRVAMHHALLGALDQLNCPLVLAPGTPGAASATEIASALGDQVAVIIDDGPPARGLVPTVIRVRGSQWTVTQAGDISAEMLQELMLTTVLFVCTGNTCRSPMAEAFCKNLLAQRLGCKPEELRQRGFVVVSAGLAAATGVEASADAVLVAREHGADLSGHRSQPLTANLLARTDYLFTMTQGHLRVLLAFWPEGGLPPRLLAGDGRDIPDPIGAEPAVYRECATLILRYLQDCLPEIQPL